MFIKRHISERSDSGAPGATLGTMGQLEWILRADLKESVVGREVT